MNITYCFIASITVYIIILFIIDIAEKSEYNKYSEKYFKCLEKRNWTKKISKKIFWAEKRKKIYFNLGYLLRGYNRNFLFWERKVRGVCKRILICFILFVTFYLSSHWKEINILIDKKEITTLISWEMFITLFERVYEFGKKYFSIFFIVIVILLTIRFSGYKRVFEGIVDDKKRSGLKDILDLNCKLAIEFSKLNYELYEMVLRNFDNNGKYDDIIKYSIFKAIFPSISYNGTEYIIDKKSWSYNVEDEKNHVKDEKISNIVIKINNIYSEHLKNDCFLNSLIWGKYDNDFHELLFLIDDYDEVKAKDSFITNKRINDYIDVKRNEYKYLIDLGDDKGIDESISIELDKIRWEIKRFIDRMIIETIWTMKSMEKYTDAVFNAMRIKNNSIYEAFLKAKEIKM